MSSWCRSGKPAGQWCSRWPLVSGIRRCPFLLPLIEELLQSLLLVMRANLQSPLRRRPNLYRLGRWHKARGNPHGPTSAVSKHFCHHRISHSPHCSIDRLYIHSYGGHARNAPRQWTANDDPDGLFRFQHVVGTGLTASAKASHPNLSHVMNQLLLTKVPLEGLEPPTLSLGRNCSSIELQRQRRKSSEHRMSPVVITLST
jgi:hypothetical protein